MAAGGSDSDSFFEEFVDLLAEEREQGLGVDYQSEMSVSSLAHISDLRSDFDNCVISDVSISSNDSELDDFEWLETITDFERDGRVSPQPTWVGSRQDNGPLEQDRREEPLTGCRDEDSRNHPICDFNQSERGEQRVDLPVQCTDDLRPQDSGEVQGDAREDGNDMQASGSDDTRLFLERGMLVPMKLKQKYTFVGVPEGDSYAEQVETLQTENGALRRHFLCRRCYDEMFKVVLLPCGHLLCCTCWFCLGWRGRCPICSSSVDSCIPVYFE